MSRWDQHEPGRLGYVLGVMLLYEIVTHPPLLFAVIVWEVFAAWLRRPT